MHVYLSLDLAQWLVLKVLNDLLVQDSIELVKTSDAPTVTSRFLLVKGILSPLPRWADVWRNDHFLGTTLWSHEVIEGGKSLHGHRLLHVGII